MKNMESPGKYWSGERSVSIWTEFIVILTLLLNDFREHSCSLRKHQETTIATLPSESIKYTYVYSIITLCVICEVVFIMSLKYVLQSKTNTHKPLFFQIKVCFIKYRVSLIYDYTISILRKSV